jgi:hypothetical protein
MSTKTVLISGITLALGLSLFGQVYGGGRTESQHSAFPRGVEGAMAQSRALLDAYRQANWNRRDVPKNLLLLADHEATPNTDPKVRYRSSFGFGQYSTDDEVAFHSHFYVHEDLQRIEGQEGRLHRSGFYIVAFKSGEVVQVPATEMRLKWVKAFGEPRGLFVFPGMRDYALAQSPNLPKPAELPPAPAHLRY